MTDKSIVLPPLASSGRDKNQRKITHSLHARLPHRRCHIIRHVDGAGDSRRGGKGGDDVRDVIGDTGPDWLQPTLTIFD